MKIRELLHLDMTKFIRIKEVRKLESLKDGTNGITHQWYQTWGPDIDSGSWNLN